MDFAGFHRFGLGYVLRLHPEIIATPGRIGVLRELLQGIQQHDDVWIATGAESQLESTTTDGVHHRGVLGHPDLAVRHLDLRLRGDADRLHRAARVPRRLVTGQQRDSRVDARQEVHPDHEREAGAERGVYGGRQAEQQNEQIPRYRQEQENPHVPGAAIVVAAVANIHVAVGIDARSEHLERPPDRWRRIRHAPLARSRRVDRTASAAS